MSGKLDLSVFYGRRMIPYLLQEQDSSGQWHSLTGPVSEVAANLCGAVYRSAHPDAILRIVEF